MQLKLNTGGNTCTHTHTLQLSICLIAFVRIARDWMPGCQPSALGPGSLGRWSLLFLAVCLQPFPSFFQSIDTGLTAAGREREPGLLPTLNAANCGLPLSSSSNSSSFTWSKNVHITSNRQIINYQRRSSQ